MITTLFVGIDVSKKSNSVHVLDSDGSTLSRFAAPNNLDGAGKIADKLKSILLNTDFSKILIGMESTSVYADHLATFLRNNDFLKKWECRVFILNAKQVSKFKDAYAICLRPTTLTPSSSRTSFALDGFLGRYARTRSTSR